ncbi:maleylpyruvate isomerase family mycothiol-dependent enzyme [Cellulomonas sp. URHE0023]|uniref:maleylpyruvate isomerase family mycothiol-dependent enzyme n=1 Tax=Cellulomonas sp. URHE0023 TaxID=1380354 RepID=UPI0012DFA2A4|nr:maleylpyruvate isomerase family mycothiol-dependent enzyme [Cellulomonas sp. URHE0023]
MDYAYVIAQESARAADALASAPTGSRVPSCPDWDAADLAYHVGEVQDFWASLVAQAPTGPDELEETVRRPDVELVPFLRTRTTALLEALADRDPHDACWSWSTSGGTVGWVSRRQAHEALVHRVDAEQTAGLPVTDPGPELAADGVDELLAVMLSGLPPWARFTPDGPRIRVRATDAGREWLVAFGRFTGTSPTTGKAYDDPCAELVGWEDDDHDVAATVSGTAWELELWLWGRSAGEGLAREGDPAVPQRLRAAIVESTQ